MSEPTITTVPQPSNKGFTIEHILISVTVVHGREIGQFDDTCARHIEKGMEGYEGVHLTGAEVQYKHCSEESHTDGCDCWICTSTRVKLKLSKS